MPGPCTPETLVIVVFFCVVAAAILNDIRSLKIENRYSVALVLLYPAHVLTLSSPTDWLGALITAGVVFAAGAILFTFRLVGGGDVKLIAALSLWAGPSAVAPFLAATTFAGGALALLMLTQNRFAFAFAFEAAGAIRMRDLLLGCSIPYAIAIGFGAAVTIGPALLAGSG